MGLRSQSPIRMKLLVLLAFIALAHAGLLYYPRYGYGHYYGYPGLLWGRKKREADAEAAPEADADAGLLYRHHYPYYYGHYYGYPGLLWGRKKREADAEAAPEADADAGLLYYPRYAYGH